MYQKDWFSIPFNDFSSLSAVRLADVSFYREFYDRFHKKYSDFDSLDTDWRESKITVANWLARRHHSSSSLLSIGSGIGFIEKCILELPRFDLNLTLYETAEESLKWIKNLLPRSSIIGDLNLLRGRKWDTIYLCNVDYAIDSGGLKELLVKLSCCLAERGELIILSTTHIERESIIKMLGAEIKMLLKSLGSFLYPEKFGQFWGWQRTTADYLAIIKKAGFNIVEKGTLSTPTETYFYFVSKLI